MSYRSLALVVAAFSSMHVASADAQYNPQKTQSTRARVMGYYSEPESLALRDQRRRCASAIRARPAFVLGPVDSPPWNRHRRLPGTT
jgi:hypothetical protein